jgi:hypothetical protein
VLSEDALAKVPVPLVDHVELVAVPLRVPVNDTPEPAQIVWLMPALTVAGGLIVITIVSLTALHGPTGSSVVSVNVTVPVLISAALGV